VFRKTMADLGWIAQFFCDYRMLASTAAALREISRDMPVIVDHLGMVRRRGASAMRISRPC
jgi:predicted TIM-barrel fold metal-dependent hydrolase